MYALHLNQRAPLTRRIRTFVTNTNGALALTDVDIGPDGHVFCGWQERSVLSLSLRYVGK